MMKLNFGPTPHILKEEYLNIYEGIQSEIFDENPDLSTTYLGKSDRSKNNKLKAVESLSYIRARIHLGELVDGKCQLLLDTDVSKSFIPKSYYTCCKSLHSLPKFASKTQRIQVGNGQFVSVLFIIPVSTDVYGHRFEIYTLVSEIHEHRSSIWN